MPRLFGHGPERGTFEHLAHKVRGTNLLFILDIITSSMFDVSFSVTNSLTSVQAPHEVHNVEFVAVLLTPWQVITSHSACFL